MKKFLEEFKAFAMRGNVIDLAVGVIIGGAFGAITTSLVNDIIMPIISILTGGLDFSDWKIVIAKATEETAETAINFGNLISVVLNFVIIAFVLFSLIKAMNKLQRKKEEKPAAPPEPSKEEVLLTEIRDLLKAKK